MPTYDVTIVGAGVSGLASAIALRQRGMQVRVYERFEVAQPIGSGLMIQPTGLAALDRLGLRDAALGAGAKVIRLKGLSESGRVVFDLDYRVLDPAFFAIGIHRAALHALLLNAAKNSGAELHFGVNVEAISTANGVAELIVDGAPIPTSELIIDASGTHSPLLHDGGIPASPFPYGAVWATVDNLGLPPDTLSQRYRAAREMMGFLPLGEDRAALFWSLKTVDYDAWRANFTTWKRDARALWPEMAPVLDQLDSPAPFTLAQYGHGSVLPPFRHNVAFIGDAAHSTSPQLGQGANQGLLDAVVLADALVGRPTVACALAAYARHRRAHVRFYQRASWWLTPVFQSDQRVLPWLRDRTLTKVGAIPVVRTQMLNTLCGLKTGLLASRSPRFIASLPP